MVLGIITIIIVVGVIIFMGISFLVTIFGGGPFVPTPMPAIEKILKNSGIKNGDRVYDIGAGDGRFVHFAEKDYGAKATGFEIDPFVYFIAKLRQKFWKWKGEMVNGNFQKHDLSDADVVFCYMLPRTLANYQKKFDRELKKGTKVISYAFKIGNWKAKKKIPKKNKISQIFMYEI